MPWELNPLLTGYKPALDTPTDRHLLFGADSKNRTCGLTPTKGALCLLSYISVVGLLGVEPSSGG